MLSVGVLVMSVMIVNIVVVGVLVVTNGICDGGCGCYDGSSCCVVCECVKCKLNLVCKKETLIIIKNTNYSPLLYSFVHNYTTTHLKTQNTHI